MYNLKTRMFIFEELRHKLHFLAFDLQPQEKYCIYTSIACIVYEGPTYERFGDSSLQADIGFSYSKEIFWILQYPTDIRACTLDQSMLRLSNTSRKSIFINLREFCAVVLNYIVASASLKTIQKD